MLPFLVTLFPIIERSRSLFKSGEQNEFTKTENERTNGVQSQIFFVIRELSGPVRCVNTISLRFENAIPWRGGDFIKSTWQPARMEISINLFSRSI